MFRRPKNGYVYHRVEVQGGSDTNRATLSFFLPPLLQLQCVKDSFFFYICSIKPRYQVSRPYLLPPQEIKLGYLFHLGCGMKTPLSLRERATLTFTGPVAGAATATHFLNSVQNQQSYWQELFKFYSLQRTVYSVSFPVYRTQKCLCFDLSLLHARLSSFGSLPVMTCCWWNTHNTLRGGGENTQGSSVWGREEIQRGQQWQKPQK